jgi:hypothetical protein
MLLVLPNMMANSIHLRLKSAPIEVQEQVKKEQIINRTLTTNFDELFPKLNGIPSLYGGYVDYSDHDGTIEFPLLHREPKIYLVITDDIELVTVLGNTVSHKNFVKSASTRIYLFERKKNNTTFYWRVTEEKIPPHNRISPLSIVLLTKPRNIVVPTGDFISVQSPNLVFPDVYLVGNTNNVHSLNNFLDIRRYFEQIEVEQKVTKKRKKRLIKNN